MKKRKFILNEQDLVRKEINEKADLLVSSNPTILEIAMTKALVDAYKQLIALTSEDDVPTGVIQILTFLGEI
jgi:hypothetical protein